MKTNPQAGMFAAAAAFALASAAAEAEPPKLGETALMSKAILCDTLDQVKAIVHVATKTKGIGTLAKYMEFRGRKDALGAPACNLQDVLAQVDGRIDLGPSFSATGQRVHAWAVHVTMAGTPGGGYVLIGYAAAEAPKPAEAPKATYGFSPAPIWQRTWQSI